jgi:pyruvate dehydrogenase E1 component alpha subunit
MGRLSLSHKTIAQIGHYRDLSLDGFPKERALELYRQMLRLRRIEEALHEAYHPADEMRCPMHFCIGQEAIPAALSQIIQPEDYLFSHHRSHGYYLAKIAPLREMFAEFYGKSTGANGGIAGSQDISHGASHFYSGAILTGSAAIAVGTAWGLRYQKKSQVSIAGFGEGATDEGAFWEAINYAGLEKLPILFIVENNRYSTFSDQLLRQEQDNIAERVRTFGVRAVQIFGNDVVLAYRTLESEVARLRAGDGPALIEAYTYRFNSHVGPEDDSSNAYRSAEEIAFWKDNCPLRLLQEKLAQAGWIDESIQSTWETEIKQEIAQSFQFAKESPFPGKADWPTMNVDTTSPLADALLHEGTHGSYNQYQGEAKLGPY